MKVGSIISEIYDLVIILGINKNTFTKAFINSRKLGISFYDSIYLSLSEDLDAKLITADKKLHESAIILKSRALMLSEFVS